MLVDGDRWRVIRRRQTLDDMFALGSMTRGRLIAFEGLDQSGKQTQADAARRGAARRAASACRASFPDYQTPIGAEIGAALHGQRAYGADVLQLLYVANRYEHAPAIREGSPTGRWWCAIATRARPSPTARHRGSIRSGWIDVQRCCRPPT